MFTAKLSLHMSVASPTSNNPPVVHNTQSAQLAFRFDLGAHSMYLSKLMTGIHHYGIKARSVTALKSTALFIPSTSAINTHFTVIIALPFPECHIVGII